MRRIVTLLLACLAASTLAVASRPGQAAAADGLATRNTTTYTIDPDAGVVHVLAEMTFTNTVPDKREGGVITRAYFTGFSLPVPAGAVNASATSATSGRALAVEQRSIEGTSDYLFLDIRFGSNLFNGQTARVNVAYDIAGLPPRSDNPSRVNPAYAAFEAFGIGDDGRVTVRVVVPPGFAVDTLGSETIMTQEGANTVYTATDIADPEEFSIFVSARNDDRLRAVEVRSPAGDRFDVRAWPGDDEWLAFVEQQIVEGLPVLTELVGRPWPVVGTLELREAYTPYLYGYAGWFSASSREIEVGEDLDQEVLLHELSHAWFSYDWFQERWLNEGFAQTYSNLAIAELGGTPFHPSPIDPGDPGHTQLNEWDDAVIEDGTGVVEDYGYNASFFLVSAIVEEIGPDRMRDVLAAVDERITAYPGDGVPERVPGPAGWRRFLDLVEEVGGSAEAAPLVERYVLTAGERARLADRATARVHYHALRAAGGTWAAPAGVRDAMNDWRFDDAEEQIEAAGEVLARRDVLAERGTELGLELTDAFETAYERGRGNLAAVRATIDDEIEAADEVIALRDELQGKADELGVTLSRTIADDYAAGGHDLAVVADALRDRIDAADMLLAAAAAEAESTGLFERIGLIGQDLPGRLNDGREELEGGSPERARDAARDVARTLDRADDVGRQRVLVGGGIAAAVLLAAVLVVVLARRARRSRGRDDTPPPDPAGSDPTAVDGVLVHSTPQAEGLGHTDGTGDAAVVDGITVSAGSEWASPRDRGESAAGDDGGPQAAI